MVSILEVTSMPILLRGGAAILISLLAAASPSLAATAPLSPVAASVDDLFSRLTAHGFSGSVLVVRHGETVLRKGYGLADQKTGTPVEPETAFEIGSITKQFTAAGILRLEMDGRLTTADRLGTFLPAIAKHVGLELAPGQIREDVAGITLHQLLTHTSGLDNLYVDQSPTWKDYLAKTLAQPLLAAPGQEFHYSNTGYDLLAMIVEVVSGVPYERYLREKLFLPAGMSSTGFDLPPWRRDRVARYQDWTTREWAFPVEMPLDRPPRLRLSGSGGMLSTVDDLYRWHQALLGDRILSAAAKEKLYHPVQDSYAYGWRIGTTDRGTRVISHGGFDSGLGVSAGFYRFVDDDVVLIVLANTNMNRQLNMEIVAAWVQGLLFGGVVPMPPPPSIASAPRPALAGRYKLPSGGEMEIFWRGTQLVAATTDPEGMLLLNLPDSLAADAPEDEAMTRIFHGIDADNWEPLRAALWADASFDGLKRRTTEWWALQRKELGSFVSVRPVHQLWRTFDGAPELQIFLLLRFERGLRLVRTLRNAAGRYLFNVENIPERIEMTLAPQGPDTYSAWSLRFQTGARLVFDSGGGTLKILGQRSVTVAKRDATARN
jgi:CubicO group peptidase (beta-lactamase class C family)